MSAGCVVIGSSTAPVREVIEHGRNGLLFDFFDIDGLVRQVVNALEKPDAHWALGAAARRLVVDRYDLRSKCLHAQVALIAE